MVDGVILLVDAAEGRCRRPSSSPARRLRSASSRSWSSTRSTAPTPAPEVLDEVFDLFVSSKRRRAARLPGPLRIGPQRLCQRGSTRREGDLDAAVRDRRRACPGADGDPDGPFKIQVTLLDYDNFLGRIAIGRVISGRSRPTCRSMRWARRKIVETGRASKLFASAGWSACRSRKRHGGRHRLDRRADHCDVGDTIADPAVTEPLHAQPIDPPTLSMRFASTIAVGRSRGQQGHQPHDPRPPVPRSRSNVALKVTEAPTRTASKSPAAATPAWRADRNDAPRRLRAGISRPRVLFATTRTAQDRAIRDRRHRRRRRASGTVVEKMADARPR